MYNIINVKIVKSNSEEETKKIAKEFYLTLKEGDIVLLSGSLGAGKTTFVKGIIEAAGFDPENCPSPTFILVQEFTKKLLSVSRKPKAKNILHVDMYRLDDEKEIEELFISEIMEYVDSHIIFIEWGEKIMKTLEKYKIKFIQVRFETEGETTREIQFIKK